LMDELTAEEYDFSLICATRALRRAIPFPITST